ncbi:MAG: hypothetical protein M5U25_00470 [Planctomycetota bacterium]|nr:hypothetical protein [Planctomycetota bacterium]
MPKAITEKIVECRTPGGRTLHMERWYYEAIRAALLEILPEPGVCAELFELHKRVAASLDDFTRESIESLSWQVAWVSLDLQQEGLLQRDAALVTRIA